MSIPKSHSGNGEGGRCRGRLLAKEGPDGTLASGLWVFG